MGFNLMAALGGAGRAMSESIEEGRLQMDKIELMDAEAATRERLAKAEEDRQTRKENKKLAERLKGMNFDDGRVAFIMAQGSGFAESMLDHASQAYANGKDPNTILKYTDSIDEFKTESGVKPNESSLPEGFAIDAEIPDISKYFDMDTSVTSTLYAEPTEMKTLKQLRAGVVQKLIEGNWTAEDMDINNTDSEWNKLTMKKLSYTDSIKELAEAEKGDTDTDGDDDKDIFSRSDARNELKLYVDQVAPTYKLTSLEGSIQDIEAGTQGKAGVARLDANITFKNAIKKAGGSKAASSVQESDYEGAIKNLQNTAITTAYTFLSTGDEGIGSRYKMPFTDQNETTRKETYTFNEIAAMKGGRPTNVQPGDVIMINNKIAIYTGFNHTYGNYGTADVSDPMVLPYIFANYDNDVEFTITDTTR
jgi:hypothetical protein